MNTDPAATYGPAEFSARYKHKDFFKMMACEHDGADYINANYVDGFDLPKKFTTTEHPMESTLNNFWTMVWQENTCVIVMLTSAEVESQPCNIQYFLYNQDDTIISDFIVKEDKTESECNYTETVLNIINKRTGELRIVHHFKFLDWPENHITAAHKLLDFFLVVNEQNQDFFVEAIHNNQRLPGPIVVHGSKDIGRTSTFCAADTCLYQLVASAAISVPSVVLRIRHQRCSSLASVHQYIFIQMVLHYFVITIPSNYALFVKFRSHYTAKDMLLLNHPIGINVSQ